MVFFLLHGFKWPRLGVVVHTIEQQLDDVSSEWLMTPKATRAIVKSFKKQFPSPMKAIPNLMLIEQYDPADESVSTHPHVFVADRVYRGHYSMGIDPLDRNIPADRVQAMNDLRDALIANPEEREAVSWYIVYCGDEVRAYDEQEKQSLDTVTQDMVQQHTRDVGTLTNHTYPPGVLVGLGSVMATQQPATTSNEPAAAATSSELAAAAMRSDEEGDSSPGASSTSSTRSKASDSIRRGFKKVFRRP